MKCLDCSYIVAMWPPAEIDPVHQPPPPIRDAVGRVCSITFGGMVPLCAEHSKDAEEEWGTEYGPVPREPLGPEEVAGGR